MVLQTGQLILNMLDKMDDRLVNIEDKVDAIGKLVGVNSPSNRDSVLKLEEEAEASKKKEK